MASCSYDVATPISSSISTVNFSYLSSEDIRRNSVKQVVNPVLFDNLNQPNAGGMYDPVFGPRGKGDICTTCRLSSFDCPGHFGHIDLPAPVFHPLYMTQVFNLLRGTCTYCHHFLIGEGTILKYIAKLTLLEHGLVAQADAVDALAAALGETEQKSAAASEMGSMTSDLKKGEATRNVDGMLTTLKKALEAWVDLSFQKHEYKNSSRDDYKKSGIVFDVRKKVIAEFLKSLARKSCSRCGAYAHRLRKEGNTKIIEYSLVAKQKAIHRASSIKRPNILFQSKSASVQSKQETRMDHDSPLDSESDLSEAEKFESNRTENMIPPRGRRRSAAEGKGAMQELDKGQLLHSDLSENEGHLNDKVSASEHDPERQKQRERIVPPEEARAHLRQLFVREQAIICLIYSPHGAIAAYRRSARLISATNPRSSLKQSNASADIFFMDVISVPPSRFRPAATMGDQVFENPQNSLLNSILRQTFVVRDLNTALQYATQQMLPESNSEVEIGRKVNDKPKVDTIKLYTRLLESLINLQVSVNSMIDSTKNPMITRGGKLPPQGVKQLLEKKEGLFRMNMMGKRVNYAARSVISPDVNIETNEIGVPPIFARKLTFPEPVTEHNIHQMRQLVINGPHHHPGATFVQLEDGNLISLDRLSDEDRIALANKLLAPDYRSPSSSRLDCPYVGQPKTRTSQINRKVYRHLTDGDIVILNRQPTLHKPSMMCHRVRVLKGEKTIRMHYANCNSYNADFDGDEMNMHFPQSLIAQAEARLIANTDNQYLVPTSGNPLRGLIQDHVVAGVWLTSKDTFFTRNEYYQLIYGAVRPEDDYTGGGMVLTLPPTIWKPEAKWTGKQVVSTILLNIKPPNAGGLNFSCKGKIPGNAWGVHTAEGNVLFVDGELLTGILDKAQIGASAYGLVHSVFEVYGAQIAGKLLSILSRVLTKFLQSRAFTCRMDDLLLTAKGNADRRAMLATVNSKGLDAALEYVGMSIESKREGGELSDLRIRLEETLRDDYKLAGLDASIEGETNQVTTNLIKICLPSGLIKPFPHNNMQTMTTSGAKGSNVNASQISCLLGQQSLEGRRVPTMVSGKTLPSFKAFETAPRAGGFVAGRFLTGIRPQEYYFHCMAGREGLIDTAVKTSRSGYLQRCLIKHLEGLRVHYDHTVRNSDSSVLQFHYGEDSLDVTKQKHLLQFEFAVRNTESLVERLQPRKILEKVAELDPREIKNVLKHPQLHQPILSTESPSTNLGSVSEAYAAAVENYIDTNPHRLLKTKKKHRADWPAFIRSDTLMNLEHFRSLMYMRYMRSLVDPGEAVGLMASQGVGEPSTQMTLNTFHFAGHGAANVTLGIPRLREIVMTASQNIKTPTMQLPIIKSITDTKLRAFCQTSSRLTLSQVVEEVTVREHLSPKTTQNNFSRQKVYSVRLAFFSNADYTAEYSIDSEQILSGIHKTFIPLLNSRIYKEFQQNVKEVNAQAANVGKAARGATGANAIVNISEDAQNEGDDTAASLHGASAEDGDADDARRERQGKDETTYESDDDNDEGVGEGNLERAFQCGGESSSEDDSASESDTVQQESFERKRDRMKIMVQKITALSRYVNKFSFDMDKGEWCELELEFASRAHKLLLVGVVEEVCRAAVVHEIRGISRCFVSKAANENAAITRVAMTEGVNLQACWSFAEGIADLDKIYTNDIGAILRIYGVEAARSSIIKEMSGVFSVYGIGVDFRHLTVIADYMTSEGAYKPFNRTGLSNNSSPFLKASFETTANFVAEAALLGDFDDLGTPSANIILGKVPKSGTGVFSVRALVEA